MMAAGPIWPGPWTWQGQWHPDRVILGAETSDWRTQEGNAETDSQEFNDHAVVGVVLLRRHCCKSLEEHWCTGSCSSCAGQHQGNEGGVFDFSDSLLVLSSLLALVVSVASGHLRCLVWEGEWVEYLYVEKKMLSQIFHPKDHSQQCRVLSRLVLWCCEWWRSRI